MSSAVVLPDNMLRTLLTYRTLVARVSLLSFGVLLTVAGRKDSHTAPYISYTGASAMLSFKHKQEVYE